MAKTEQQGPVQPSSPSSIEASQLQAAPTDAGRRRLLQGGLAAGPVIFTLFSRPAFGTGNGGECKTPSGFLSGNLSQHGNPTFCSGRTPGYWKQSQHFSAWPAPYFPTTTSGAGSHQATKFHSGTTGFSGSQFGTKTMLQVMEMGGGGYIALGRHITAALLNAAAGLTPVLSETQVRDIWNEFVSKGYYEPSAGIRWYPDQIVAYLVTTMPLQNVFGSPDSINSSSSSCNILVQAEVKWRLVPADSLCWHEWAGEIVVFNDLTGNTHLLNPIAGLVLRRLVESGAAFSAAGLAESIGLSEAFEPDIAPMEAVEAVLTDLERYGLAAREPA